MGLAFVGKSSSGSLWEGYGCNFDVASPIPLPPLPPAALRDQTEDSSPQLDAAASRLGFRSLVYSEAWLVVLRPVSRIWHDNAFTKSSSRRRRICHCPRCYVSRRTSGRTCMSPDHLFPITHLSLVLHNHATAAAKCFYTVGAKAPFQVIESSYAGSVDCGEDPCCRISVDCLNWCCGRISYIGTHKQRP